MKMPLAVAVILGIIAALCTGLYLNSLENKYKKGAEKYKVLVAKQYIDQGTIVDASLIEEQVAPKEYIQPKAISSLKDLISSDGRRIYMALVPIEKGEQIITTKLSVLGRDTGISSLVPTDKRAVTLVFEKEFVSGIIKPGNRVDIIGIFDYQDKNSQSQEAAFTILQNILILATGSSVFGTPVKAVTDAKNSSSNSIPNYEANEASNIPVSFAVSLHEAEILMLASQVGTIKFALRPMGDDKIAEVQNVKISDICKDISVTSKNFEVGNIQSVKRINNNDIQNKQKEVLDLLKKYQK